MTTIPRASKDFFQPAFIVGITGHMDLDPTHRERVKSEVNHFFAWLRASSRNRAKNERTMGLGPGLGLQNTPIILLSSLAPGADQWVVEAAKETNPPVLVLAPLPFLKDQYLEASTFKSDGVNKDEAASKFLTEFPDQDVFVVRLLDEIDLDDNALRAKHKDILTAPSGKKERDHRYAAAGEYVAAYSDILIAVTDKPIGQTEDMVFDAGTKQGARAIAELKRRGLTPGLLPTLPTLSWADNGPVIHIYAPRISEKGSGNAGKWSGKKAKSLEVLYPYNCRPPGISEKEDDNPEWLRAGHDTLKSIAEHLERLNTEKIHIDPAREEGALAEMLPSAAHWSAGASPDHGLQTAGKHLHATLDRLARLRRRTADYSAHYNAHLTRLKRALFGLAFASALFFALADNWDAKGAVLPLPQIFFVTAMGLSLAAWIVYFCFKKTAAAERCEDYRAIAEGLRVQFYWTACGSGQSVASNYLLRQHGELGWIRKIISIACFPYEPNRVQFNQLSANDQRATLQDIRETWFSGQFAYFKKTMEDLNLRREVFSTCAQVLLWTGFVLFAFFFFFATISPALPRLLALLAFAAGSLVSAILYRETFRRLAHGLKSKGREREKKSAKLEELVSGFSDRSFIFPKTFGPERIQSWKGERLILNGLAIGALSLSVIGMVYLLEGGVPWLPSAYKLGSICKYLALAGGVLCSAWVEVNFFEEHIRQYASMASLFQAAGLRFDDYWNWTQQADQDRYEEVEKQALANIQELIVAVGREALSENAEWFITHRTRPLEPVSV